MFTERDREAIRAWARRKGYEPEPFLAECEAREEATHMFTCPRCGMRSNNRMDAREGYCGNCHDYTRGENRDPGAVNQQMLAAFERTSQSLRIFEQAYERLRVAFEAGAITAQQFSAAVGRIANRDRDAEAEAIGLSTEVSGGSGYARARGPEENFVATTHVRAEGAPLTLDTLRRAMEDLRYAARESLDVEFVPVPPAPTRLPDADMFRFPSGRMIAREAFERDLLGSDINERGVGLGFPMVMQPDTDPAPYDPRPRVTDARPLPPEEPTRRKIVL